MLIYARRQAPMQANERLKDVRIMPPQRALDVVRFENEAITRECEDFEKMYVLVFLFSVSETSGLL
jgi:hypothetical protein